MAAKSANGSGNGERSGARILALLATPLNVRILRALGEGPRHQTELRRKVGLPAQTTLRAQLKRLGELDAIEKQRRNDFPGIVEHALTTPGQNLLFVVDVLERWLERAPEGPLALDDGSAKAAVKALAESWSTTMLRVLAIGSVSLTELAGVIVDLSYPSLERRLAAMRLAGQIEACPGNGTGTPYAVTEWLRRGVAPIVAAVDWERRHLPNRTPPLRRIDVEAVFLLAAPLLSLPGELSGSCRMAVELPKGSERRLIGVVIEAAGAELISCATQLDSSPDSWALGSASDWLAAMIEHDVNRLELGGDCRLAAAFVAGLHEALFALSLRTAL